MNRPTKYATLEEAKKATQLLGIKSSPEYFKRHREDPRLRGSPHVCYAEEWKGWYKFLDRKAKYAYEEAKNVAQLLDIKSRREYSRRCNEDPRLPKNPNVYYKDMQSWYKFLNKKQPSQKYTTLKEAHEATKSLGIKTKEEYRMSKRYKEDLRLPSHPDQLYVEEWKCWEEFLGAGSKQEKRAKTVSILDYNKTYATEETCEFIDGFLLGDGHLSRTKGKKNACLMINQKEKECADYFLSFVKQYGFKYYFRKQNSQSLIDYHARQGRQYSPGSSTFSHIYRTTTHPDLTKQRERWYSEEGYMHEKKHIPVDVCLSPLSVLVWWIGDGSLAARRTFAYAIFCTQGFPKMEIETILLPKLNELGFEAKLEKSNNIRLGWRGTLKMLDYIEPIAQATGGKLKCYFDSPSPRTRPKFLTKEQRSVIDNFKHFRPRNLERLTEVCDEKKIKILSPWNVDGMKFGCLVNKSHSNWVTDPWNIIERSGCHVCGFRKGDGKYTTYKEAKKSAMLLAKSCREYAKRYKEDEMLPCRPDKLYSEWENWYKFLGTKKITKTLKDFY